MAALNRHLHQGNDTERYPLEVVFGLTGPSLTALPGERVTDWSVGLSVGFATCQAALLFAIGVMEKIADVPAFADVMDVLWPKLVRVLRLRYMYQPVSNIAELVNRSIGAKMAASERQRPNVIQLSTAFGRVSGTLAGASRKSKPELLNDCITNYNRHQSVSGCKISSDERLAIKLLGSMEPAFLKVLRKQWSRFRVADSAVPMSLLASKFLQRSADVPVCGKTNPLWAGILTPTPAKYLTWINRVVGRFEARLDDAIARGVRPVLAQQRDADPLLVWQICCLWTYLQEALCKLHSEKRLGELNSAFCRGYAPACHMS